MPNQANKENNIHIEKYLKIKHIPNLDFKISFGTCVDYLNSNESLNTLKKCIKEILCFKKSIKDLTH